MLPPFDLGETTPQALRALAEYLRKLSAEISAHADKREADEAKNEDVKIKMAKSRAEFYSAGAMMMSYIENGTPIQAAIELITAATGYDEEQVRFAYSLATRQRRQERDIVIAWLKKKRWTDAQIAQVVDMHEKSVTRLRSQRDHC